MMIQAQRTHNLDGRYRQKRGDTHLSTLEKTYGEISDRRGDTHLSTLREITGLSLSKLVRQQPEVTHLPGLNGRQRNQDGRIRQKRADTLVATLRETYGQSFASGFPGCWTLGLVREVSGMSLSQMVKEQ
ncbi:MAG: hypothetical protein U0931_26635 [Vulcanimicrobiota bacterium]